MKTQFFLFVRENGDAINIQFAKVIQIVIADLYMYVCYSDLQFFSDVQYHFWRAKRTHPFSRGRNDFFSISTIPISERLDAPIARASWQSAALKDSICSQSARHTCALECLKWKVHSGWFNARPWILGSAHHRLSDRACIMRNAHRERSAKRNLSCWRGY